MSDLLISKIDSVRRRQLLVWSLSAIGLAVGTFLVLLGLGMLADWLSSGADGLPQWVRLGLLVIYAGVVGAILIRYMIYPIIRKPDDDAVALLVEEAEPKFATRLIAAIQLSRPQALPAGASVSMVKVTVRQAEKLAGETDFPAIIPTDGMIKTLIIAGLIVLLFAGGFLWGNSNNVTGALLQRAFLANVPVPRKTHIKIDEPNLKVPKGDTVVLKARAEGVVPDSGTVFIETDSGRKLQFPLAPDEKDTALFACQIQNVQESFKYYVRLNDGQTPDYSVRVLSRPAVTNLAVTAIYPAYTRRGQVQLKPENLTILNGSRLRLVVTANHELHSAGIHLIGAAPATQPGGASDHDVVLSEVPMAINPARPAEVSCEFDIPQKTTGFAINLVDTDNLKSSDGVVYRVDLVAKKDPVVKITWPLRKEELVTKDASLGIGYDVYDEFGLSKLTLNYQVDDGPVKTVPINLPANASQARGTYPWSMTSIINPAAATRPSLDLTGSSIVYWLEAQDTNTVTGPGKGLSDKLDLRVVTAEEKQQELAQRAHVVWDVLKGVQEGYQKTTEDFGKEVRRGPGPSTQP